MLCSLFGWIITCICFLTVMTNNHKNSISFRNLPFHVKDASILLFATEENYKLLATGIDYDPVALPTTLHLEPLEPFAHEHKFGWSRVCRGGVRVVAPVTLDYD